MLTLIEELFLLSIDDHKGIITPYVSSSLRYGLAGGLLAELALRERVTLHDKRLSPVNDVSTGDQLFDEVLARISREDRTHKATYWVNAIASKKLSKQVAAQLAQKNILRIEEKRYLWVIPYEAYPQVDASAKYWVKQRLRSVVLAGEKPEPQTVLLLSLLKACRMLDLVFTRDEQKAARKKVDFLVKGEAYGRIVAQTIEEIEAAATAAV
ncbi:MAG TPA: GPP34 family phosphoprotein, partial [Anaerolineales bacterium]